MTPE
jgi:hypothetical protein